MAATIVLSLILTFLVGGMMLALAMGYRSIEADRAARSARQPARSSAIADALASAAFFHHVPSDGPTPTIVFDDALVAQLERHVRAEQATVSQFVHYPSVESLYSKLGSSLHVH